MHDEFEMKDSGERRKFASGALRDRAKGKGRYDLISPIATRRLAIVLEKGAEKYDPRNWEKGMHLGVYLDSAKRHIDKLLEGMKDEDHAGQAMFNIMAFIHTQEMIKRGILSPEFDDMPNYIQDDDLDG